MTFFLSFRMVYLVEIDGRDSIEVLECARCRLAFFQRHRRHDRRTRVHEHLEKLERRKDVRVSLGRSIRSRVSPLKRGLLLSRGRRRRHGRISEDIGCVDRCQRLDIGRRCTTLLTRDRHVAARKGFAADSKLVQQVLARRRRQVLH